MRFRLFFILLCSNLAGFATHNRAGYISYSWLYLNTYKFRVYTYTNLSSSAADRCSQTVYITDIHGVLEDSVVCPRVNTDGNLFCGWGNGSPTCSTCQGGSLLVPSTTSYGGVRFNIYEATYTFTGPDTYILNMLDPNRDNNVNNIQNSGNVEFALSDTLRFYNMPGLGTNNSPIINNPPIQNACQGQTWCYNPIAINDNNDSLVYSLIKCLGQGQNHYTTSGAVGWSLPSNIHVNSVTGELCWDPVNVDDAHLGEYNVAMSIKEYRRNSVDGKRYLIGETDFDIQIYVVKCPSQIKYTSTAPDTCIVAETHYVSPVISATGYSVSLPMGSKATGLPFTSGSIGTHATYSTSSSGNTVNTTVSWVPSCQAIQLNPYYITVNDTDNSYPLSNAFSTTFFIKVISPAPVNLVAQPVGNEVNLSWNPPPNCAQVTGNIITKYLIYRADNCTPYVPSNCQTGVSSTSGYIEIGTMTASSSITTYTFTDDNLGMGLAPGNSYSYIVVAQFADGSLSIASANQCVHLSLGIPLLMKVSVDTTDTQVGQMSVWWKNPFTSQGSLDTIQVTPPYKYVLKRKYNNNTYATIYTVTEPSFSELHHLSDTTYTDIQLNTQDSSYYYKLEFYSTDTSSGNFVLQGTTSVAGSIYLTAQPHDKKVYLSWTAPVPWKNYTYYVYRQDYTGPSGNYVLLGKTASTSYTVTGLTDNYNYCFKVKSVGEYESFYVSDSITNFSQKACAHPFDDEAPCQPNLSVVGNCGTSVNSLTWTNPDSECGITDVVKYYIYYTPKEDSTLTKIDSLLSPTDTTYNTVSNPYSIAGCYVIVAVDSAGNQSPLTNETCTDNCPEYELPNIFTPNGDSLNDLYIPIKNRYIQSVDFVMFNRWGEVVFKATDPELNWNGKSKQLKQLVPDGTYYYFCTVNELHYYGIKKRELKGFVQVLR